MLAYRVTDTWIGEIPEPWISQVKGVAPTEPTDKEVERSHPLPMKYVYAMARKQIWAAAVARQSPIETFGALKGKTIGYPSESPAIAAFVDARMHDDGASKADTKSIATGYGVTSMEALKTGRVDAFIAWPGPFASFQNAGYDFRVLPDVAWQIGYYGIGQHPDIVAKIGRGIAMTAVVLKCHPEAIVRALLEGVSGARAAARRR
jgi:NitT/TauT family transport system substrate-binding protein